MIRPRSSAAVLVVLALSAGPAAATTNCVIDPAASSVRFTAWQLFGLPVLGEFTAFGGNLSLDEARPERSSAEIVVDTTSVDTQNPDTDDFIRSESMLDSTRYPTAVLKTSAFDPSSAADMLVRGELALKSKRRPVAIPFSYRLSANSGPGDRRVIADGSFEFSRLNFDVGTGLWTSTFLFHEPIRVTVHLEVDCPR